MSALPWQAVAELPPAKGGEDDERFWSVTTLIKQIGSNDGLIGWAANRVAQAALDNLDVIGQMVERGQRTEALQYLTGARFRPRPGNEHSDSDVGSEFHRCAELWQYTGKRPEPGPCNVNGHPTGCTVWEAAPLLDSYGQWLDKYQPLFEALELTVYNPTQRYAGTLDAIVKVDDSLYVLDYKTSLDPDESPRKRKQPWSDVALQLAAYRWAEFAAIWRARTEEKYSRRYYLLSEDERAMALPMPTITDGLCLHVTPWHCDLYPVQTGREVYERGFLAAVDAARWTLRDAQLAIDAAGAILLDIAPAQ